MKKKITVLHVNYNDVSGGAARYVMRLHNALLKEGIDSKILVMNKESDHPSVFQVNGSIFKCFSSAIDKIPSFFFQKKTRNKFSSGLFNDFVSSDIRRIDPDIVHLHWINNGMASVKSLLRIEKPIVWSILDMWPYTGGAHYDFDEIKVNSSFFSRYLLRLKTKIYSKVNFTAVAISKWVKDGIIRSGTMDGKEIRVIHPCLDLSRYRPVDKFFAKKLFDLPLDRDYILFGAVNSTTDNRKGFRELIAALRLVKCNKIKAKTDIVVFGSSNSEFVKELDFKVHFVGKLKSDYGLFDDVTLSALYSLAALTITPALQEAFGQVAIESLSCGVPVVAFEKTGLEDVITHKKDGYLSKFSEAKDLAEGIVWTLNHSEELRDNCLRKVKNSFDEKKISRKFIEIYEKKLKK